MESEIVFLGGVVMDMISYAARFPLPGETLVGTNFFKGFGGKSCNQCVMSANLGTKAAMVAKIGEDSFGREFLDYLGSLSINTEFVTVTTEAGTSSATITVTESGENSIVHFFGAINHLGVEDVRKATNVLFEKAQLFVCSMECPESVILESLTLAKQKNLKTILNAAPCNKKLDNAIYGKVDILCVNETEASVLTGLTVSSPAEAGIAAAALQKLGSPTVVVTLGDKGALILEAGQPQFSHVSCPKVKAIDTTGAGDAFMGTLAHFLVARKDLPLSEIVRRSCVVSSISVQGKGTQASFPKQQQLPEDVLA